MVQFKIYNRIRSATQVQVPDLISGKFCKRAGVRLESIKVHPKSSRAGWISDWAKARASPGPRQLPNPHGIKLCAAKNGTR